MENVDIEQNNDKEKEKAAERERLVKKIYELALEEHAEFKEIPEADFRAVIETAVKEIEELENAANPKEALAALTPEIAEKIKALWVFSGPGTYDDPVKDDRYKNYSWAKGMDHTRLSYAALLSRKISEIVSGEEIQSGPLSELEQRKEETKKIIAENGPTIIYNGTELENSVVRDVVTREGIIIPPEKLVVMGRGIDNTVDQVKTFVLPEELHEPGGEVGIVSHAPHIMRIIHMLSRYEPLPRDMTVRLFPIATPEGGREEYTILEVKGLLYHVFIGKNAKSAPCRRIVHGADAGLLISEHMS